MSHIVNPPSILKQSYGQGFTGILLFNFVRIKLELGNIFTFIISYFAILDILNIVRSVNIV